MRTRQAIILVVLWGTRVLGALFVVGGLAFFVTAWVERSLIPMAMGVVTIGFGMWAASVRATSTGGLDYRLFRRRS
jgi:HAMP domain-containing protein